MQFTIPGGQAKGTPLAQAETKDIRYWLARRTKELAEDPRGEFAAANQRWIDAARAELQRRERGGQQQAPAEQPPSPAPSTAIAKTNAELSVLAHDPAAVTQRLEELSESYHLVAPATSVSALPPGCGIAVSMVSINPSSDDVYSVGGGKVGLSGHALQRIGAAAGVSWDPVQSGRLDDGKHPRYVHFRAVGTVRNFDGTSRTIVGEVELDMREGSPQVEAMRERAKSEDGFRLQYRDTCLFILRHAETKARLRAIASIGVKRSYTPEELRRPFAVASLTWTGQTDDPELRREMALRVQESMLGASAALYGPPRQPRQLGPARHPAPPVGVTEAEFEDSAEAW